MTEQVNRLLTAVQVGKAYRAGRCNQAELEQVVMGLTEDDLHQLAELSKWMKVQGD